MNVFTPNEYKDVTNGAFGSLRQTDTLVGISMLDLGLLFQEYMSTNYQHQIIFEEKYLLAPLLMEQKVDDVFTIKINRKPEFKLQSAPEDAVDKLRQCLYGNFQGYKMKQEDNLNSETYKSSSDVGLDKIHESDVRKQNQIRSFANITILKHAITYHKFGKKHEIGVRVLTSKHVNEPITN